jgi:multisite-specific tRNA:(cytosine-C5)-methyltransferase
VNLYANRFDAFYRAQGFVADGQDWDNFKAAITSPLPACFRLNPNYPFREKLKEELIEFSNKAISTAATGNGDQVSLKPSVELIPWFTGGSAYKLGTDRRNIRRNESLDQLHKWMIKHTDNGNITRQEAVSMVPPLALDVRPHHRSCFISACDDSI